MPTNDAVQGSTEGFAEIAARLDYPMVIVTTRVGDERSGCLVGFTTQVAIDPPRYLVAISDKNRTFRLADEADHLAVHILSSANRALSELFGEHTGDDIDKFARCAWSDGPHGLPILDEAEAWFTGRIVGKPALGDHVGFLLEPDRGELRGNMRSLLTFQAVSDMEAGHGA